MFNTCSLFDTVHAEDSGGKYDDKDVKSAARPYADYLKAIRKWHSENSVSWEVVHPRSDGAAEEASRAGGDSEGPRRPGAAAGGAPSYNTGRAVDSGARPKPGRAGQQRRRYQQRGIPVSLEKIDDDDLHRISTELEHSDHVYEHDRNTGQKAQRDDMIKVIRLDRDERTLWLERRPTKAYLRIQRNTYQLNVMIGAVESIMYRPHKRHMPLRRLFQKTGGVTWPDFSEAPVDKWFFLNGGVEGLAAQRQFVRKALATPDFAFLEGPPGSGKTTALCELVTQMASRGKRVLFCASTHVAVDNLLERLVGAGSEVMTHIVPIRIGVSDKISGEASLYKYDNFVATTERKIQSNLSSVRARSRAQDMMLNVLRGKGRGAIGSLIRNHANLVCGTAIGIPAHPDIRRQTLKRFDMMILDEASKTTLQEFLVPAVHADRWVIVGDTRQLVPYVDPGDIEHQVAACLDGASGDACLDAFMAARGKRAIAACCPDSETESAYDEQCIKLGVRLRRPDDGGGPVKTGEVVIGSEKEIAKIARRRPDVTWRRGGGGANSLADAGSDSGPPGRGKPTWASEVAWRISEHWPGGGNQNAGAEKIRGEIDMLMPQSDDSDGAIRSRIDKIRRIAVPSILELTQHGFAEGGEGDTLLERGMPAPDFEKRHVLLEWQHRMHHEIARFPHLHVYEGQALKTPDAMRDKRDWQYRRYSDRAVWIDVRAGKIPASKSPSNEKEAECVAREIAEFVRFAGKNPRPDGKPWEVAVLPFYTGQMRLLRELLRRESPRNASHTFRLPAGKPSVLVKLRTVDSFQGHEADLVILSMVNSHPTMFLSNPNRLNVALTRARYQCVVVGDRRAMSRDSLLGALVKGISHWTEATR